MIPQITSITSGENCILAESFSHRGPAKDVSVVFMANHSSLKGTTAVNPFLFVEGTANFLQGCVQTVPTDTEHSLIALNPELAELGGSETNLRRISSGGDHMRSSFQRLAWPPEFFASLLCGCYVYLAPNLNRNSQTRECQIRLMNGARSSPCQYVC